MMIFLGTVFHQQLNFFPFFVEFDSWAASPRSLAVAGSILQATTVIGLNGILESIAISAALECPNLHDVASLSRNFFLA